MKKIITILIVTAAFILGFVPTVQAAPPDPASQIQSAIVVLGARIDPSGRMPHILKSRIDKAAEMSKYMPGVRLIVTGGRTSNFVEAEVMKKELISRGVPEFKIFEESSSLSTDQNASNTAPLIKAMIVNKIYLITNAWHMDRASNAFKRENPSIKVFNRPV